jgi:hypothetical protein
MGGSACFDCYSGRSTHIKSGAGRERALSGLGGRVFAYAGFSGRTSSIIRSVVGAMGLLFLLSGLLVAFTMSVLGFPFEGRGWELGLVHAAFGGLTMVCAVLLPCSDESASP